jgi:two-component system, OmpR family, manganese sensing sensor histidine kinase
MFQATRRRLALWYTLVTAVLLLVFASGFYGYVRSTLIERIDDTLNHVVEVVQRSLVIEAVIPPTPEARMRVNVEASFRDNAIDVEDDHIDLEWFNPTGQVLWSTFVEPIAVPLKFNTNGETVHESAHQLLRQITHRVEISHQVLGYLRVSHPWFEVTKPTRQLILDLSLGTSVMVGIVAAIGWFLSGLAMEPIRDSYQRLKQFTADASHELRNPIAIIQTNVQVALSDPDPDPAMQQHHLQVVERLTRRLGRLVDDLLFLARQDSGIVPPRRVEINLKELLNEVVEEQRAGALAKSITLTLEIINSEKDEPAEELMLEELMLSVKARTAKLSLALPVTTHADALMLRCDRDQISQLFTNLISNAVQYTPTEGKVTLTVQPIRRNGFIYVEVKIIDTGIGIPEASLSSLFDRFYRVDPARTQTPMGGSGLGLAIAQVIVENHAGQIQIASQVNQGTIVTVTLPQSGIE